MLFILFEYGLKTSDLLQLLFEVFLKSSKTIVLFQLKTTTNLYSLLYNDNQAETSLKHYMIQ